MNISPVKGCSCDGILSGCSSPVCKRNQRSTWPTTPNVTCGCESYKGICDTPRCVQAKRDAEALAKLQRLIQEPSVVEQAAEEPSPRSWREAVIKQLREGKTLKTICLRHDEWSKFIDGCKVVNA